MVSGIAMVAPQLFALTDRGSGGRTETFIVLEDRQSSVPMAARSGTVKAFRLINRVPFMFALHSMRLSPSLVLGGARSGSSDCFGGKQLRAVVGSK